MKLTRRNFLEVATGASALALAACANSNGGGNAPADGGNDGGDTAPEPAGDAYAAPDASVSGTVQGAGYEAPAAAAAGAFVQYRQKSMSLFYLK